MDPRLPEYQPVSIELQTQPTNPAIVVPPMQVQTQTLTTAEHRYVAKPNNCMTLSALTLLFCCCWPAFILAIVAMIYSVQVDLAWQLGHHEAAKTASEYSRKMGIMAIVTGVLVLFLMIVSLGAYYGVHHQYYIYNT